MTAWTLTQIQTKVKNDLDLNDETFITSTELTAYINEAIDEAEQEINAINEDYFLTSEAMTIVSGTQEYSLPTTIYASKIRGIIYNDGNTVFPIERVKNLNTFEELEEITNANESTPKYKYILKNTTSGVKLELYPSAKETSSTRFTIWYLRNAKTLSSGTDECDIPEGIKFVIAHTKKACLAKEFGGVAPDYAIAYVELERKLLVDSLSNRIPDNNDTIPPDFSIYREHN